jgi:hypothetical protein
MEDAKITRGAWTSLLSPANTGRRSREPCAQSRSAEKDAGECRGQRTRNMPVILGVTIKYTGFYESSLEVRPMRNEICRRIEEISPCEDGQRQKGSSRSARRVKVRSTQGTNQDKPREERCNGDRRSKNQRMQGCLLLLPWIRYAEMMQHATQNRGRIAGKRRSEPPIPLPVPRVQGFDAVTRGAVLH